MLTIGFSTNIVSVRERSTNRTSETAYRLPNALGNMRPKTSNINVIASDTATAEYSQNNNSIAANQCTQAWKQRYL